MKQVLIIGGGVIGLSIAYELSRRQHRVTLLEKNRVGRATSWAGAGIFPPVNGDTAIHPLEKLESLSHELHRQWAAELIESTSIDTGYVTCGGIYLARTGGEIASLMGQQLYWEERQIIFEVLSPERLSQILPCGIGCQTRLYAVYLPGEAQIRNPRHLRALASACKKNGVEVIEDCGPIEFVVEGNETQFVRAGSREFRADHYCVAAGAWSERLLAPFKISLPSTPVRGQMVLFKLEKQIFAPVLNEGTRYLVPRSDGHVLAGATIEEVGFNTGTEPADIAELVAWANEIIPACNSQTHVDAWAGLRPGTYDGFPYLGMIGKSTNASVATGHFKAGLHLSPGTAVVIADLIEDKTPQIDLSPFSPARAAFHQPTDSDSTG